MFRKPFAPPDRWETEISAFERADRQRTPPPGGIVFVGSSTIRLWKTLERDFPGKGAINRGFGGSQIADSTRLAPRIIVPYQPRQVVFFAGTNDISAKKSARQVAADFAEFALTLQMALPRTRLSFIEITTSPSRWEQRETVVEANRIIERLCKRYDADFIPARERFFGPDGKPRPELFIQDRLHLNADGYKILADAVRPFLR